MRPRPVALAPGAPKQPRLAGKVALITGGDSGIGRAVAVAFAQQGARVSIVYRNEHQDARETVRLVESEGQRCLAIAGDVGDERFCRRAVRETRRAFRRLDILVNNAGEQHPQERITGITARQLERTFRTNIFAFFYHDQGGLAPSRPGGRHHQHDLGHRVPRQSTPRGLRGDQGRHRLVHALPGAAGGRRQDPGERGGTRSDLDTADRRVLSPEKVATFGSEVPMGRAGEPHEVAPCYVFLACDDAAYMTGQVLHPNGGEIING